MKTNTQNAFVNQLLIGTLVVFVLGGGAGLSTIWLRHQISITANDTLRAEQQITETERNLTETNTRIAFEQSPDMLERRNREFRLGLAFPAPDRIVRVSESVEERLARKQNENLFHSPPPTPTFNPGDGITPVRRQ